MSYSEQNQLICRSSWGCFSNRQNKVKMSFSAVFKQKSRSNLKNGGKSRKILLPACVCMKVHACKNLDRTMGNL